MIAKGRVEGRKARRVAVAAGSNLGDRGAHLAFAVARLSRLLDDLKVSRFHETEPVGVLPQARFLNAAMTGAWALDARGLLDALFAIERARGRERPFEGAPRTLDLDLILFGEEVVAEEGLIVPHPRFRARRFVLEPLAEIAPDMRDPVTGLTVEELLGQLPE